MYLPQKFLKSKTFFFFLILLALGSHQLLALIFLNIIGIFVVLFVCPTLIDYLAHQSLS